MKSTTFSVCLCLLFFYARADVSELAINKHPNEIQTCIVLTNHEDPPTPTEVVLPEEVTATTVVPGVPRNQHEAGHPDYQGPYHYVKPKVELEYAVPVVPEDVPPQGRDLEVELPKNEYLPPAVEEKEKAGEDKEKEEDDVPPEGRNEEFLKKEYLPPVEENKIKRNVHFGRKLL